MPEAPAASLTGAAKTAASRRRAVLMILGAACLFSLAGACVKALGGQVPLAQVVLCRNFFAVLVLLPVAEPDASIAAALGGAAVGTVMGAIASPFRP
jgi:hypothetical protein